MEQGSHLEVEQLQFRNSHPRHGFLVLPLRDDIPTQRTPFVNWLLIGVCVAVYLFQWTMPEADISERFGFIPSRLSQPGTEVLVPVAVEFDANRQPVGIIRGPAAPAAVSPMMAMLTCVFLHGGLLHLAGNMWFLWIFGDNIEDRFGHVGYLVLYLACGFAASLTHYLSEPSSMIPTVGASGAIAGVMGSYLISYPHARVLTLIPLVIIFTTLVIPAPVFLTIWLGIQFFGVLEPATPGMGGVAWWAHIGGFLLGLVVTYVGGKTGLVAPVNRRRQVTRSQRVGLR